MPEIQAKPWKFTQTGGEKKSITLDGWAAPHGRPRRGAITKPAVELRQAVQYYPGNRSPTRHLFGVKYDPWELHGRFMDHDLGPGGARAKVEEITQFIADLQPVTIEWGDVLAGTGILERFEPGAESEAEWSYVLRFGIDSNDHVASGTSSVDKPRNVSDTTLEALQRLDMILQSVTNPLRDSQFNPTFLDSLTDVVDSVMASAGSLAAAAQQLQNFEDATADQLARLRAAIGQLKTGLLTVLDTFNSVDQDALLMRDWADANVDWFSRRAASEVASYEALALLAEMDDAAEIAEFGQSKTIYRVKAGDSWESISNLYYGDASGANKLRQANGARYGDQPLAGAQISVPV